MTQCRSVCVGNRRDDDGHTTVVISPDSGREPAYQPTTATTNLTAGMDPAESLRVASEGFDLLFANDLVGAVDLFSADRYYDSPFHIMGLGVCAFLKAALGMEVCCPAVTCHNSFKLSAVSQSSWKTLHNALSHHRRGQRSI